MYNTNERRSDLQKMTGNDIRKDYVHTEIQLDKIIQKKGLKRIMKYQNETHMNR